MVLIVSSIRRQKTEHNRDWTTDGSTSGSQPLTQWQVTAVRVTLGKYLPSLRLDWTVGINPYLWQKTWKRKSALNTAIDLQLLCVCVRACSSIMVHSATRLQCHRHDDGGSQVWDIPCYWVQSVTFFKLSQCAVLVYLFLFLLIPYFLHTCFFIHFRVRIRITLLILERTLITKKRRKKQEKSW